MAVLLQAAQDRGQAILGLDTSSVSVGFDGQPVPDCGQLFLMFHPGPVVNEGDEDLSLDEFYDVFATLTMRIAYAPQDRFGAEILYKAKAGLYANAEMLRAGLHMDYTLIHYTGGVQGTFDWSGQKPYSLPNTVNGFTEPLKFRQFGKPEPKGPEWFWAPSGDEAHAGVAMQIDFVRARREQTIESEF